MSWTLAHPLILINMYQECDSKRSAYGRGSKFPPTKPNTKKRKTKKCIRDATTEFRAFWGEQQQKTGLVWWCTYIYIYIYIYVYHDVLIYIYIYIYMFLFLYYVVYECFGLDAAKACWNWNQECLDSKDPLSEHIPNALIASGWTVWHNLLTYLYIYIYIYIYIVSIMLCMNASG